jgi:hypothetical protein
MLGESVSSIVIDGYGECDVSLRNYHSSDPSIDENFGLSRQEANKLLQERLGAFRLSSGDLHVTSNGKCTFSAVGDHSIDVSIRDDTKAVVISMAVHKEKPVHKKIYHHNRASYSLMTKMMKHNTFLSQAAGGKTDAGRVGVYDGTFILFYNMGLSVLSSNSTLKLVLDDFMVEAVQISIDFANTRRPRSRSSQLLEDITRAKAA